MIARDATNISTGTLNERIVDLRMNIALSKKIALTSTSNHAHFEAGKVEREHIEN